MTNYWGALQMRAAQEGSGKGTFGGRGIEDPSWVNEEEGKGGGLESKTLELGRRKGKGKGKRGKGHQGMEHTEERRTRGMERSMHYPWYKDKVPLQHTTVEGEVRWTWRQHMEDYRK